MAYDLSSIYCGSNIWCSDKGFVAILIFQYTLSESLQFESFGVIVKDSPRYKGLICVRFILFDSKA